MADAGPSDGRPAVAVCMKWVSLRPDVDPLTAEIQTDDRFSGPSPADEAALELALRMADSWGATVVAMTVGPPAGDAMLRIALACGASQAVRIDPGDCSSGAGVHGQPLSREVASALAAVLRTVPGLVDVVCGDWSLDRGSASVPPFIAHELGVAQLCGLVSMTIGETPGSVAAERRLDGGRRERLEVTGRAVLSVEGATARLRRASLAGVLAAARASIDVVPFRRIGDVAPKARVVRTAPYRPRARLLDGPDPKADPRQRVIALTGALSNHTPPQRLVLDPVDAADRILAQLEQWGYR